MKVEELENTVTMLRKIAIEKINSDDYAHYTKDIQQISSVISQLLIDIEKLKKQVKPDLTGRKAKCIYCGKEKDSNENLPFFEYRKDKEFDRYYCGCEGWD